MAHGPFAGALLAGFVENEIDDRLAGLGILLREDVGRDLDQEAVEFALVPLAEDLVELLGARVQRGFQDRVGLADELHVAVLDAVVHHLHVVAGAVRAHVAAARLALGDGRDLRVDRRERLPAFVRTARHDARAFQRAFLPAAHADAEEVNALFLERLFAALRVGPERVAAVDDDVAGFEQRDELLDDRVHRRAGLDHDLRAARALQRGDEILAASWRRRSSCPCRGRSRTPRRRWWCG